MFPSLTRFALVPAACTLAAACTVAAAPACLAQTAAVASPAPEPVLIAEVPAADTPSAVPPVADLPDAPGASPAAADAFDAESQRVRRFRLQLEAEKPIAPKYATVIQPGETAQPLHGAHDWTVFSLHDSFSLWGLAGVTISAGWSQVIGTKPHYGPGWDAFGKREGAAALRSTIQNMSADLLFCPVFHDDPRYYVMGNRHGFMKRALYAASRVVVTRSMDSPQQRINAPMLLGYGMTAAVNNAYYPDGDRGAKNTFETWATSLGGAALGMEVDEFATDILRLLHHKD